MRLLVEWDRQESIVRWQRGHPGVALTPEWEVYLGEEWETRREHWNLHSVRPPCPGWRPWPNPFRPWPEAADDDPDAA